MAQKMTLQFRDEDSEVGRSQIYLPDNWGPAGFFAIEDLSDAIKDISGASLESAQETSWISIGTPVAPVASAYDIRDKVRLDFFIHGPVGVMSIVVPSPLGAIFVDSDNCPTPADLVNYPILEAAVDEMIGVITDDPTPGAAAAFGYKGGKRIRYERKS